MLGSWGESGADDSLAVTAHFFSTWAKDIFKKELEIKSSSRHYYYSSSAVLVLWQSNHGPVLCLRMEPARQMGMSFSRVLMARGVGCRALLQAWAVLGSDGPAWARALGTSKWPPQEHERQVCLHLQRVMVKKHWDSSDSLANKQS